jgi:hypothetical protein
MDSDFDFQANQIVCLEYEGVYLYGEVIQVVTSRQLCWVRPLMLVNLISDDEHTLWDLRDGADLLWPLSLFRVAFDTEVIPFLMELHSLDDTDGKEAILAHRKLREFIGQIWQAYPSVFPPSAV